MHISRAMPPCTNMVTPSLMISQIVNQHGKTSGEWMRMEMEEGWDSAIQNFDRERRLYINSGPCTAICSPPWFTGCVNLVAFLSIIYI